MEAGKLDIKKFYILLAEYREKLEIRKALYLNRSSCGNHTELGPQDEQYNPIDIRTENNSIRIKELTK